MPKSTSLKVKPVSKETLPEKIIARIRELMDSGQLQPGSKLPGEREFAKLLKVGRSSLREALKGLSLLGVLDHRPGDGTYLLDSLSGKSIEPISLFLSLQRGVIDDLLEVRRILDISVVELAAQRRSDDDLVNLNNALEKMAESLDDPEAFYHYDTEFHGAYFQAAGNPILSDLLVKIYRLYGEARDNIYKHSRNTRENMAYDLRQHTELLSQIQDGDGEAAKSNMARYLDLLRDRHVK